MKIQEILSFFGIKCEDQTLCDNISLSSENVNPSTLFIALQGKHTNGNRFIDKALQRGAKLVLSEIPYKRGIYIENLREKLTGFCLYFYGNPELKLKLYGVTGTNGKSTVAYLCNEVFNHLGVKSQLFTTTDDLPSSRVFVNTTPYGDELAKAMSEALEQGITNIVMEISSIGIINEKLRSLKFEAIILNDITRDHVEDHGSLKKYRDSKINYLLTMPTQLLIYPSDVYRHHDLRKKYSGKSCVYYSRHIKQFETSADGMKFSYDNNLISSKLLGKFNGQNIVAVYSLFTTLGYHNSSIINVISKISPLKGRMEIVTEAPMVIIDYAHTITAFKKSLQSIAGLFGKKNLIVVFGSGGERDFEKRSKYGKYARKYAKNIIVTEDNSRKESLNLIIQDIISKHPRRFIIRKSREDAIKLALVIAQKNSVIVIVGKGNEKTIEINGVKTFFNDEQEVKKCLKKLYFL